MEYRQSLPRETLRGEFVKSFGEREVANTLLQYDVPYFYERNHRWSGVDYKPDFMVPQAQGGVIIEYFHLTGDPDYDEMSEAKRGYWGEKQGWTLLDYTSGDLTRDGVSAFRRRLVEDLQRLGVSTRLRSDEEIRQQIRHRAIDRFTGAMTNFVGRCRKQSLSLDELDRMLAAHHSAVAMEAEGVSRW